ncbi:hypothetical protein HanRHA438_Chr14g0636961 [Helianthus annuus]|uniref:Uncharacterized protein n=1 Tax=Helianthus annuus TaxID=4232 RepID=A0A9K3H757_HELAN|nr:hypothetical protein HanXRQr2_Chr14g0627211 [Helianthus annuus]KAJ0467035.1 hypothetical protein HanIR_Chr14g0678761 [Helianthus annuus]KAJ0503245.1 hypothetical protein HanHA300_Chr11g0422121 [Helianthus annuus]KAJ0511536.1 hypothetical protein HanIR_Chr11g0553201 [Helianthus annuus]KAJ0839031.1 hypothetical protein HanPSC8_Chr14g0601941 [Helianthus annuus]
MVVQGRLIGIKLVRVGRKLWRSSSMEISSGGKGFKGKYMGVGSDGSDSR